MDLSPAEKQWLIDSYSEGRTVTQFNDALLGIVLGQLLQKSPEDIRQLVISARRAINDVLADL